MRTEKIGNAELMEIIEMQKRFAKLYVDTGLMAVTEDYVQVDPQMFGQIFKDNDASESVSVSNKKSLEVSGVYEGVKFVTLM